MHESSIGRPGPGEPGAALPLDPPPEQLARSSAWLPWLALDLSTGSLLGAILLVGMATELWLPLLPEYLDRLDAPILLIALYGSGKDLVDALAFYFGGSLAARFNTRRALLFCNLLPLGGMVVLLAWPSRYAVFLALPFLGVWNSISGPAMLRVVGESLSPERRSMAIALQSIQKRLSSILAYAISGGLVVTLGEVGGVRAGLTLAVILVMISWLIQHRFMRTAVVDAAFALHRPWHLLRQFDPQLRRLLLSDVLARWCDGMPRELLILYCISLLHGSAAETRSEAAALYVSVLLSVMNVVSLLLYVPVGYLASKDGAEKKPYIGVTFLFFALFPLALVVLGSTWGFPGLVAAFAVGGLREIGEPARKAMITELAPRDFRTQAIGLYWAIRSMSIMAAPLVGGLVWVLFGPEAMLWSAAVLGLVGAGLFYVGFRPG